ncbi:unnamed protein product [Rhizoctonia solani]|uniref:Restriction of telomere capping protein 4 n=1 Tax=Rhizoctonia solani TaxID=456999 RepID=A0A8H3BFN8_9AGAM|nr:unnamed protein product [Rhizoctonia solani]
MERRRQDILDDPQPLGPKKNRRMANFGFGEDLGSTDYHSRPKIARNPRAKSNKEKDRESAKSRRSPVVDADPDDSYDPIDLISSQESEAVGLRKAKLRTSPATVSKPTPQPAPFGKSRSAQPATKGSSISSVATKAKYTRNPTGKSRRIVDSDEEDLASRPPSWSSARSNEPKESSPQSEQENANVKPIVRGPQPAPFKKRTQTGEVATEKDKPSTSAPKVPAPPPWKTGSASQVGSNLDIRRLDDDSISASQRVGESQLDRESLRTVRIPKRNDKNSTANAQVLVKEPRTEPKKTAAFPMAGYAKEAAAKQTGEATGSRSPRKRFKPDDVERIFKQVEQDELMGNLCPFCDEPFPDNPSPDLMQLLADLRKAAVSEPRLRNPNGLTAPLMTYINLCQMHRAESTYVEQGRRNHWPSVIDWDDVRERLMSSEVVKALRSIIDDPHSSEFFVTFYNTIKRDGALKAASIRAQLDTFELSHPGYYGEQGFLVFFDILNELFPNLTPKESKPLTTRQFFMSVLVPEAAALLIEQDMDCTHEEALVILRESRQYGLAMFPDRGGFFGSGRGDHMDEAGAKQLEWRKDMVGSTYPGSRPEIAQSPMFKSRFLEEETDPDVLIVD